jgi:hypothetical protein
VRVTVRARARARARVVARAVATAVAAAVAGAVVVGLRPCSLALPASPLRLTQTQRSNSKAAATKAALAALLPICRSGSS